MNHNKTMKSYRIILSAILLFICRLTLSAQVTIGIGHAPAEGALLQLKENEVNDDSENATKGLVLPRVFLTDVNNLYPMFLADPKKPGSGANAAYQQTKAMLDKTHCGLLVYNTNDSPPFRKGLYMWTGSQWMTSDGLTPPWLISDTGSQPVVATEHLHDIYRMGHVTIGSDAAPDPSAIFNAVSSNKGVLLPRVTLTANNDNMTIPNPTEGVMVYNTGKNSSFPTSGYMYWNGTEWKLFSNISSVAPKISQLYCDRAELSPGSYKKNLPYIGILKIPYSGGNGGWYNTGSPIISNGLVFYLQEGKLENGIGELVFAVQGAPQNASGPGGETTIKVDKNLVPFYTGNCTVSVGSETTAEVRTIATMGPLQYTTENGVVGYGKTLTTPDRKFSIRIFVPTGTDLANADLQIRNNQRNMVDIMWSTAYGWKGSSSGASANKLQLTNGLWAGNGPGDSGENMVSVSSDKNAAWGNEDVYYSSSPEQRSYMWTSKDTNDQTFYHLTFMMGASDIGAANNSRAAAAKAFLKIDQIRATN